jgi:hypothetical protein
MQLLVVVKMIARKVPERAEKEFGQLLKTLGRAKITGAHHHQIERAMDGFMCYSIM